MFHLPDLPDGDTAAFYAGLNRYAGLMLSGETDFVAQAANLSALLMHTLRDISWAGFYIMKDGELILGPFQGKPACLRIQPGRGVCGTAASERRILIVDDVATFPGHIACDSETRSEIVIPVIKNESLIAVLDIDSPERGRFTDADGRGLEQTVSLFSEHISV